MPVGPARACGRSPPRNQPPGPVTFTGRCGRLGRHPTSTGAGASWLSLGDRSIGFEATQAVRLNLNNAHQPGSVAEFLLEVFEVELLPVSVRPGHGASTAPVRSASNCQGTRNCCGAPHRQQKFFISPGRYVLIAPTCGATRLIASLGVAGEQQFARGGRTV